MLRGIITRINGSNANVTATRADGVTGASQGGAVTITTLAGTTSVAAPASGAGAAALACLNLLVKLGLPKKNIFVTDLAGVVYEGRTELMDEDKIQFAQKTDARTLAEVLQGREYWRALGDEIPAIADCFRYFAGLDLQGFSEGDLRLLHSGAAPLPAAQGSLLDKVTADFDLSPWLAQVRPVESLDEALAGVEGMRHRAVGHERAVHYEVLRVDHAGRRAGRRPARLRRADLERGRPRHLRQRQSVRAGDVQGQDACAGAGQ